MNIIRNITSINITLKCLYFRLYKIYFKKTACFFFIAKHCMRKCPINLLQFLHLWFITSAGSPLIILSWSELGRVLNKWTIWNYRGESWHSEVLTWTENSLIHEEVVAQSALILPCWTGCDGCARIAALFPSLLHLLAIRTYRKIPQNSTYLATVSCYTIPMDEEIFCLMSALYVLHLENRIIMSFRRYLSTSRNMYNYFCTTHGIKILEKQIILGQKLFRLL